MKIIKDQVLNLQTKIILGLQSNHVKGITMEGGAQVFIYSNCLAPYVLDAFEQTVLCLNPIISKVGMITTL